jgi:hypothetical protein
MTNEVKCIALAGRRKPWEFLETEKKVIGDYYKASFYLKTSRVARQIPHRIFDICRCGLIITGQSSKSNSVVYGMRTLPKAI